MSEHHVVVGGGPLGRAVARRLVADGHRASVVQRQVPASRLAGVAHVVGDVRDVALLRRLAGDAVAVYQCAQPAYTRWSQEFPSLQAAIITSIAPLHARLVLADNLYAYGKVDGPISEDTPERPQSRKGRVRQRMLHDAFASLGTDGRVCAVRAADFYGPEVTGSAFGDRFFGPLITGSTVHATGALDVPHAVTHVADMARTMIAVARSDTPTRVLWLAPTAPAITQRQLAAMAAAHHGLPLRITADGRLALGIGGLFAREAWEVLELLHEFTSPFVVDSALVTTTFGIEATSLERGVVETVDWYRTRTVAAPPASARL
ncbi:MAG TPA: NAD-dependent epimerase/dehydratase family protein [Gemmatimonadaceae bacterium]|nr:NAD-dependent epimerase/dehydratase family protein [Gemmatimonadaceae bacterium]